MSSTFVVGYDFSDCSHIALDEGLRQAALQPGSAVHVIMVLEEKHQVLFPDVEVDYQGAGAMQVRLREVVAERVQEIGVEDVEVFMHVRLGDAVDEILALAAEAEADVIVIGTHGHGGVKRWLVGSVAEKIVREAHCQVVVARPKDYTRLQAELPEPPCPACVDTRARTGGASWWCEDHAKPYVAPHRYRYDQNIAEMQPDDQPLW